jgi:hypothetical protein
MMNGDTTGDLYINDAVLFRHVPDRVWHYELGGYPVIKKWLGYRDRGRRPGIPLPQVTLGQRVFRQPFSWKTLGVDVGGRSATLAR